MMKAPKIKAVGVRQNTLGAIIDDLYRKREARLAAQKAVDRLKEEEKAIEDRLIKDFGRKALASASGAIGTVSVSDFFAPTMQDWTKFYAYVKKHNAFELLHKRVSTEAWNERREAGELVPGTEVFKGLKLSLRKRGS